MLGLKAQVVNVNLEEELSYHTKIRKAKNVALRYSWRLG